MKFKKPKFWDYNKPNILSYLFLPISLLLTILKSFKHLTTTKKKYSKSGTKDIEQEVDNAYVDTENKIEIWRCQDIKLFLLVQ